MNLRITRIDTDAARAALAWRYPPPYDYYNIDLPPDQEQLELGFFLDPINGYYRIDDLDGNLVGVCCFGADAQVSGGDYRALATDIGLGIAPRLIGQGNGHLYTGIVLDFARAAFPAPLYRVTIASFNLRARRVWENLGFRFVQRFHATHSGMPFVILTLPAYN